MGVLFKNARVLTIDDDFSEMENCDVLVLGEKIQKIGKNISLEGIEEQVEVIDATNKLIMPGLVNGHFHSPGNFRKGALPGLPLEIFMLYEVPPLSDTPPDYRMSYIRTMIGNMEMLKRGITAVHDDAFYVPVPTEDAMDGLMASYVDSGIRAVATIDQPNVIEYEKYPYLKDILPENVRKQMEKTPLMSTEELMSCYKYIVDKWHLSGNGRVKVGASISAPQRVKVDYFGQLSDLSKNLDIPFDIHVLETKLQRVLGQEKYKKSLIKYVNDLGYMDERVMIIHAIWVDDEDVKIIADSGASIAHNPLCNLRLGSGVMNFRRAKNYGINICIGTDEACSDDAANVWMAGKVAGLIHNITEPDYRKWPTAKEIVWALTRGGAKAMRNDQKTGIIKEGYDADLIMIDLNTLNFTPLNDIYKHLVYIEDGTSVVMTMVAGKIVMRDGKLTTVDEEAIKEEAREIFKQYKIEADTAAKDAELLEPYYREMYLRCAEQDVGMNRWVG